MNKIFSLAIFFIGFFIIFGGGVIVLNIAALAPKKVQQPNISETLGITDTESTQSASADEVTAETTKSAAIILPSPTVTDTIALETPVPTAVPIVSGGSSLLAVVNDYRAGNGKSNLSNHDGLCRYIQSRESDIKNGIHGNLSADVFAHYCPECSNLAENIARGYDSDSDVLSAWLASNSHKSNIEGEWIYACALRFGDAAAMMFGR